MYPECNPTFYVSSSFFGTWLHTNWHLHDIWRHFSLCFRMFLTVHLYAGILRTSSLTGILFKSEVYGHLLAGPLCTCGSFGDNASMFSLFYAFATTVGTCLVFFIVSSFRSVLKHISPCNILIIYLVLAGLLLFISTNSNISVWPPFLYLGKSPTWNCEVVILDYVYSFQTLFGGIT